MSKNISEILPIVDIFEKDPDAGKFGYSDHYGAVIIASRYCGLENKNLRLKHCWQHGCAPPWFNIHPGTLIYNLANKKLKYFVARKDQELILRESGYTNTHAIGLPIIYCNPPKIERTQNSLLIMPSHVLVGMEYENNDRLKEYIEFLSIYIRRFDFVAVCIHSTSIRNGHWVKEFTDLGIEIIEGANTDDKNALIRQSILFQYFEYLTTDAWGSQIAYGLYYGMKVSICGPSPSLKSCSYLIDDTWRKNPHSHKMLMSDEVQKKKHLFLKRFFAMPDEGICDVNFGKWLVGYDHKVSPEEMKSLFNWRPMRRMLDQFAAVLIRLMRLIQLIVATPRKIYRRLAFLCNSIYLSR